MILRLLVARGLIKNVNFVCIGSPDAIILKFLHSFNTQK